MNTTDKAAEALRLADAVTGTGIYRLAEAADMLREYAALLQAQAKVEPQAGAPGWKLVPVEPTPEMLEAWRYAFPATADIAGLSDAELDNLVATNDWRAMLAAAPQPDILPKEKT